MSIISRIKESAFGKFWLKYEKNIVILAGLILISAVSFEAGYLHGQKEKPESVAVNKVACAPCPKNEDADNINSGKTIAIQSNQTSSQTLKQPVVESKECTFVASKNSNKYHLATCQWAQRIKPENKICFSSKEEAEGRGYIGAKCCIK
jgi:hypothetical protein